MQAHPRVWRVVYGYVNCAIGVLERMPQNGYCPSHQHLAETEELERADAQPIAA